MSTSRSPTTTRRSKRKLFTAWGIHRGTGSALNATGGGRCTDEFSREVALSSPPLDQLCSKSIISNSCPVFAGSCNTFRNWQRRIPRSCETKRMNWLSDSNCRCQVRNRLAKTESKVASRRQSAIQRAAVRSLQTCQRCAAARLRARGVSHEPRSLHDEPRRHHAPARCLRLLAGY